MSSNTKPYIGTMAGFGGAYAISNQNVGIGSINSAMIADSAITINSGPNGSMKVDVPLIVNGRDVVKELDEMRDALLLLKRDVDMEAKYPKLKKIKDEYKRALDMYTTFETIKESK